MEFFLLCCLLYGGIFMALKCGCGFYHAALKFQFSLKYNPLPWNTADHGFREHVSDLCYPCFNYLNFFCWRSFWHMVEMLLLHKIFPFFFSSLLFYLFIISYYIYDKNFLPKSGMARWETKEIPLSHINYSNSTISIGLKHTYLDRKSVV